ncbi:hypothetical protein QDS52_03775 [Acinetobacter baumannii]|uniref:hypothetical protein n=1 Tax=Acinetobacter baumannii TaxID=470 RepID=UPI00244B1228|nr:hypothetical protein [Acinetobacter baumannii]MDH2508171.1 hypothetical protein [Acinetobacter baumannii]
MAAKESRYISLNDALNIVHDLSTLMSYIKQKQLTIYSSIESTTAEISCFENGFGDALVDTSTIRTSQGYFPIYYHKEALAALENRMLNVNDISPIIIEHGKTRILLQNQSSNLAFDFDGKTIHGYELERHQGNRMLGRLTTLELFVCESELQACMGNYPPSTTKSTSSRPIGKSRLKAEAQIKAAELARARWEDEKKLGVQTKLLDMAKLVRADLQKIDPKLYEQTESDESVKKWIKEVSPNYATKPGRPRKSLN